MMETESEDGESSEGDKRECPECGAEDWEVYDSVPASYTDEPGIKCGDCGMLGTAGGFSSDVWMWGWP